MGIIFIMATKFIALSSLNYLASAFEANPLVNANHRLTMVTDPIELE